LPKPSATQLAFLMEATSRYHQSLPGSQAEGYLASRGLEGDELKRFRLGVVDDPLPGHDMYRGWLAIPYLRYSPGQGWCVVNMRFRCIQDHDHGKHSKYLAHPGGGVNIYNTLSVLKTNDEIAICEGELDAVAAELAGIPAVGIPGRENWKSFYYRMFLGYDKVFILADGDQAGKDFAFDVMKTLPQSRIINMPEGEDVNSTIQKFGKNAVLKRMGKLNA
jgi:DNA primase